MIVALLLLYYFAKYSCRKECKGDILVKPKSVCCFGVHIYSLWSQHAICSLCARWLQGELAR